MKLKTTPEKRILQIELWNAGPINCLKDPNPPHGLGLRYTAPLGLLHTLKMILTKTNDNESTTNIINGHLDITLSRAFLVGYQGEGN